MSEHDLAPLFEALLRALPFAMTIAVALRSRSYRDAIGGSLTLNLLYHMILGLTDLVRIDVAMLLGALIGTALWASLFHAIRRLVVHRKQGQTSGRPTLIADAQSLVPAPAGDTRAAYLRAAWGGPAAISDGSSSFTAQLAAGSPANYSPRTSVRVTSARRQTSSPPFTATAKLAAIVLICVMSLWLVAVVSAIVTELTRQSEATSGVSRQSSTSQPPLLEPDSRALDPFIWDPRINNMVRRSQLRPPTDDELAMDELRKSSKSIEVGPPSRAPSYQDSAPYPVKEHQSSRSADELMSDAARTSLAKQEEQERVERERDDSRRRQAEADRLAREHSRQLDVIKQRLEDMEGQRQDDEFRRLMGLPR